VRVLSLRIVVKNIDARIKNIKKQVYPIIKKHEKTFFKTFSLLEKVKIDHAT